MKTGLFSMVLPLLLAFLITDVTGLLMEPFWSWLTNPLLPVGFRQSPISLSSLSSLPILLPPLQFINHNQQQFVILNSGEKVEFRPTAPLGSKPILRGGPLANDFNLVNVHFHWNTANDNGVEHVIDNNRYAAEVHAVYGNGKYAASDYSTNKDSYFVVGFQLKVCPTGSSNEEALVNLASTATTSPGTTMSTNVPVKWTEDIQGKHYFLYAGSLTTPTYSENVVFAIMRDPFCVTQAAMNSLKSSQLDVAGHPINNVRSLQARNLRPVFLTLA